MRTTKRFRRNLRLRQRLEKIAKLDRFVEMILHADSFGRGEHGSPAIEPGGVKTHAHVGDEIAEHEHKIGGFDVLAHVVVAAQGAAINAEVKRMIFPHRALAQQVGRDRDVEAFRERRDMMVAGLNEIPGIRCRKPGGAFYLFPNIAGMCESLGAIEAHKKLSSSDGERSSPATLVQMFLLWRHQVATMDRRSFGSLGSEGQHFLRLSIATALDDLKVGLERIRAAASDVGGFQEFIREGKHLC
jgi:hypothetical protein